MSFVPVPRRAGVFLVLLGAAACASRRILVPPRLDLVPYGSVGLVTFTVENARGSLQDVATRRFGEAVLRGQSGIELRELGPADVVLRQVGETRLGPTAARRLGGDGGVPVVFFGHLRVSDVKPSGGLLGLSLPHVEATVSAELVVELLSTKTGGTLWRSSAVVREKVGELGLSGGVPYFSAKDPDDAYGRLVARLVNIVTYELRPTWQEQ